MTKLNWQRQSERSKDSTDGMGPTSHDPGSGSVVLEWWLESGLKRIRKFGRVIDAVRAAWQGRPATINKEGIFSVTEPTGVVRYRIRAHGVLLSAESWRLMKVEIKRQAAGAKPGTVDHAFAIAE